MTGAPRNASPINVDKLFRTALIVIPIGVLGNIIFSWLTTDRSTLVALREFPRGYLLLAVALGLLPWLTNALRLLIWTHFLGHKLAFREAFRITLAVDLGSAISPTAVGGGFLKWGLLVQRGVKPGVAASITTLPTLEDALFFLLALPTAVLLSRSWNLPVFRMIGEEFRRNTLLVLLVGGGIALGTWLLVRVVLGGGLGQRIRRRALWRVGRSRRRLRRTWHDAREVFRLIADHGRKRFAISMGLTAIQWISRYSVISALAAFLGASVDPVLFWVFQWVVFTLMAFIPTPGAAGGAEAVFYFIYSAFLPDRVIGLATAGWRFLTFYLQLGLASILFALLNLHDTRLRGTSRSSSDPANI
jgi:uncharacterized protein (TIRG00374 family)